MLQTPVLEYCQNSTLRGRKPSSNRPQDFLQQVRAGLSGSIRGHDNDIAVDDDVESISKSRTSRRAYSSSLPLRALPGAHMSGNSTTISLPRYREAVLDKLDLPATPSSELSPASSFPCTPTTLSLTETSQLPERIKLRIATALFVYFLFGWADGLTSTVLPYFKAEFNLTHMTSSLLFIGNTIGNFAGTLIVERLLAVYGLYRTDRKSVSFLPAISLLGKPTAAHSPSQAMYWNLVACGLIHAANFIMMGSRRSFPVLVLAYVTAALARSLLQASMNPFLNASPYPGAMALAYALWSFGGVVSPIVCQTLMTAGVSWGYFYYGSLLLSAVNTCLTLHSFRPTKSELKQEKRSNTVQEKCREHSPSPSNSNTDPVPRPTSTSAGSPQRSRMLASAVRMPYLWAFALFMFLYLGSEITTQGFMVTYLLGTRNPPKSIGYVTSGFWACHAIGRLLWAYFVKSMSFRQRMNTILVCMGLAVILQFTIVFVKSYIANAVSASLIGMVFAPVWPGGIGLAAEVLPKDVTLISLALIGSLSSLGGSTLPFATGALANTFGVDKIGYSALAQTILAFAVWKCFPSRHPRS